MRLPPPADAELAARFDLGDEDPGARVLPGIAADEAEDLPEDPGIAAAEIVAQVPRRITVSLS